MRYPTESKNEVRTLRRKGLSLGQIQQQTNVPKTTIRGWISDITLTSQQQLVLKTKALKGLQLGRKKAGQLKKGRRIRQEKESLKLGLQDIGNLTQREQFIAGIALYWAEGFKNSHEHRLGFCNSDPRMIKFYIAWLHDCLNIPLDDLTARLTINLSYKNCEQEIQQYWSKTTGIPIVQFTKTFYQASIWKKHYDNSSYYGVLRIHVKGSLAELLKMKGWIEGLKQSF